MKEILANAVLIFAWLEAVFFVIAYHFKTGGAWRETPLGRNVMAMMAAVVALLGLAMLRTFVPWLQNHLQDLRLVAFAVVAYIIGRRVQLLFRYQREGRLTSPGDSIHRRSPFLDGAGGPMTDPTLDPTPDPIPDPGQLAPSTIPPVMGDPGRRLSAEEYDKTYASGDGGHKLPPDVLESLDGHDDPEAVPPGGLA